MVRRDGGRLADHLVNGLDNLEHLVVADLAVAVNVVQLEGPVELVLHLAAAGDAEGADELLEVDGARLVRVEDVEDVVGKGGGVAEREELGVDLLELALGEHARGAVFEEAYTGGGWLGAVGWRTGLGVVWECTHPYTIAAAPSCQSWSTFAAPSAGRLGASWTVCRPIG